MLDDLFNEIELNKESYKKDLEIELNEVNRILEKNKFIVEEYAVISGDSVKYTGNDLMEAYRQYNNWNRENKNIVYAKIEKGTFMDSEIIIDKEIIKTIK